MRRGLLNASNTQLQVNGAAHGTGIYLSPTAMMSFGYTKRRRTTLPPAQASDRRANNMVSIFIY